MTTIEKTILRALTNEWQKLPQITIKVAEKIGVAPNDLEVVIPFYCGVLTEHNKIETKPVPLGDGEYYLACRKKQVKQEVPY